MTQAMSQTQAKSEALRLAHEGKSYAEIAEHLKHAGYVTPKAGRPLWASEVGALLRSAGHRVRKRYKKKMAKRAPTTRAVAGAAERVRPTASKDSIGDGAKLAFVKSILTSRTITERERIAFALQMIG